MICFMVVSSTDDCDVMSFAFAFSSLMNSCTFKCVWVLEHFSYLVVICLGFVFLCIVVAWNGLLQRKTYYCECFVRYLRFATTLRFRRRLIIVGGLASSLSRCLFLFDLFLFDFFFFLLFFVLLVLFFFFLLLVFFALL